MATESRFSKQDTGSIHHRTKVNELAPIGIKSPCVLRHTTKVIEKQAAEGEKTSGHIHQWKGLGSEYAKSFCK